MRYVDDIIVFGATEAEFVANDEKIFSLLEQYNVNVKPSKVKLGLTKVEYVRRDIHHDGTTMQDEKTQEVLDFPLPDYVRFLRSFMGLAEYFRNYVYGSFSEVMQPLRKLASISEKNKNKLKWDEVPQAKESFYNTKGLIANKLKSQLKWSTIQKEARAVDYCITKLEYLLRNNTICLMTDHANLVYFNKSPNMMVNR